MRPRYIIIAVVAAAVLAAGGYTAYWFAAAAQVRDGVAEWAEARRAEGFEVSYGAVTMSGFPARLIAVMAQPMLARPDHDLAWRWNADALVAEARPWAPERIAVTLPATQRIVYRRGDGVERMVTITLEAGVAHVVLAGGVADSIAIEASGIAAETPRGPAAIDRFEGAVRRGADHTVEVSFDARRITLTPDADGAMGREVAALAAAATVAGALPEAPLRLALRAWAQAGGTVEIHSLSLRWGALALEAAGTLTLDNQLRPEAALSAEIAGYGGVLDAFAEAGAMAVRDASIAKTFLNLMAKTKAGRRVLEVPLSAQDGKLYVGPLPLLELGPVLPD